MLILSDMLHLIRPKPVRLWLHSTQQIAHVMMTKELLRLSQTSTFLCLEFLYPGPLDCQEGWLTLFLQKFFFLLVVPSLLLLTWNSYCLLSYKAIELSPISVCFLYLHVCLVVSLC